MLGSLKILIIQNPLCQETGPHSQELLASTGNLPSSLGEGASLWDWMSPTRAHDRQSPPFQRAHRDTERQVCVLLLATTGLIVAVASSGYGQDPKVILYHPTSFSRDGGRAPLWVAQHGRGSSRAVLGVSTSIICLFPVSSVIGIVIVTVLLSHCCFQ